MPSSADTSPAADLTLASISLRLRHFGVAYDQKIVHSDLNWELRSGAVHLLFGAAGCGKSTLLKALAGWHRRIPSMRVWGSAQILGCPFEPALVHQSLGAFVSTVGINLANAMPNRSALTQAQQRELARQILAPVDLSHLVDLWHEPMSRLEALQRKQACLALALIEGKNVLLLDEPGVGLANNEYDLLARQLTAIAERCLVIVVTHDANDQQRYPGSYIATLRERYTSTPQQAVEIEAVRVGSQPVPAPVAIRRMAPSGFHWVWEKQLAALARPGLMADVDEDFLLLKRLQIDCLLCLEESIAYAEAATRHGIEVMHFAIQDMQAPASVDALRPIIQRVIERLHARQRIGVHCRAGLGRTGLILGCILIEVEQLTAAQSLRRIRSINPRFVQSDEQASFLESYTPANW